MVVRTVLTGQLFASVGLAICLISAYIIFKFKEILECHEKIKLNNEVVTDDTMVVEKYGYNVYLYNGEYTNIKVTTKEDLILAEKLV